jgi:hypothetical protein
VANKQKEITLADVAMRLDVIARLLVCQLNGTKGSGVAASLVDSGMPAADVAALLGMKVQAVWDACRSKKRK